MLTPSAMGLRIHRAKLGISEPYCNSEITFGSFLCFFYRKFDIWLKFLHFVCFIAFFYFENTEEHFSLGFKIKQTLQ